MWIFIFHSCLCLANDRVQKNSLRFPFRARRMQRVQSVNSEKRYPKRRVCSLQRAIVSYFWSRVQPREETKEK